MSFSCPHFDPVNDYCERVQERCVCGRPGCVLARNSTFAIPPAIRLVDPDATPPCTLLDTRADDSDGADAQHARD